MNRLTTKYCKRCDTTKPLDEFHYRKRNGKYGYMYRCKVCDNEFGRMERAKLLQDPSKKQTCEHLLKSHWQSIIVKNTTSLKLIYQMIQN
jgi:predicted DNA-binding protein (MmcQ/YjbR family)